MRNKYILIDSMTELNPGDIIREPNKNENYDYYKVLNRFDNHSYTINI